MRDHERRLRALALRQDAVVSAGDARRCGFTAGEVDTRVRRREWRALLRGVYLLDGDVYETVPLRARARAALLAHPDAVLGVRTAAALLGVAGIMDDERVEIVLAPDRPRAQRRRAAPYGELRPSGHIDLQLHWFELGADAVTSIDGLRTTTAVRTVADVLLAVDRLTGLSVLDSALFREVLHDDDLPAVEAVMAGRPGVVAARELLSLADGRAQSPLESRVRLRAVDGGVRPDELQYSVVDRWGVVVGVADLMWRRRSGRPLVAEADGADPHSRPQAVFHDRHRGNDFTTGQVDCVRFTWADTLRPAYVPTVIRANLVA